MLEPETSLVCVVEIPKGSRNKYEYDPEIGGIKFDRLLMTAATFPADYGYLRETLAADGGPLDGLVCLHEPTFSGCLIPVKPLGLFEQIGGWGSRQDALAEIATARESAAGRPHHA
jgi:inorganic pyrophosphatase